MILSLSIFAKKKGFLVKFDAKKWILRFISIPKMYEWMVQKLQWSIYFKKCQPHEKEWLVYKLVAQSIQ